MSRIENVLFPLLLWRQVILTYAALLGLEGPALLLAAYVYRRPRVERLVALVPVAACCALLVVARGLFDTYAYWLTYTAWEINHYPPTYMAAMLGQTAQDAGASARGAAPLGIGLAALTAALLVGGWSLLLRWQAHLPAISFPKRRPAMAPTVDTEQLEITVEAIEVGSETEVN